MTVQRALYQGISRLNEAGIDEGAGDARRLMAAALGVAPGRLTLHLHDDLTLEAKATFEAHMQARVRRVPVSHLLGGREFYGRWFKVNGDVLDPRPETETLLETALDKPFSKALDLGTGSGAIALTLAAERSDVQVVATDISQGALHIAQQNAEALGVADRVTLKQSDWFVDVNETFDLIVSNPPYIALQEMHDLSPELDFEPRMALTDEEDGLAAYRVITRQAGGHLEPGGILMVEMGWKQGQAVADMFVMAGFAQVVIIPDLDGRDRVVSGIWPATSRN